ncbi:DUF5615 family PIN-like protein [Rufibacter sediminis]|uniref:DUF5615 family PIN-like protein n=1 Tax=Rufibacter sediminis TaxID=2762756 RepID=A0ABR6VS66_9BACT|nr:DUF5615 family PIN-like protein [Rufibacter sediminis]MBC3539436.1 DUF5615 family PIN-like protein [Rufibacter sediminis]
MKLLLDENLPKRLKTDFAEHEIYTVRDKGWNGKKNGELMLLLFTESFDALLTFDKNLQFQQNFTKYSTPVLLLAAPDNTYMTLSTMVPVIREVLAHPLRPGPTVISF